MVILQVALAALLAVKGGSTKPPARTPQAVPAAFNAPELARVIKSDLETIAGAGTVNVTIDGETHFTTRIAIPGFNSKILTRIYARETELHQTFPDVNFDFYFDGPELARAIKADLESIAGRGTVDVTVDSKTLFNVRIAPPDLNSELYSRIFDRELEFYRVFPDLSFDFYLRPKAGAPAPSI
jgi:hypothetical protein